MITYKVYKNPNNNFQAVKSGFAWLSIPFVTCLPIFPAWFLFRGLWKIFIIYILTILILASIDYELYGYLGFFNFSTADGFQIIILIVEILILLLPGFMGNEWTAKKLQKDGYKLLYTVKAHNKNSALELAQK
jgi:hypothetical protein